MSQVHTFGTPPPSLSSLLERAASQSIPDARAAIAQGKAVWSVIPTAITAPLAAALREDSKLGHFVGRPLALVTSSTGMGDLQQIAAVLIARVHMGFAPSAIQESLYEIAQRRTCKMVRVQRLDGVEVAQPIQLTPACSLVPPLQLPRSLIHRHSFTNESSGAWQPNCAALVYRDPAFKFVTINEGEDESEPLHRKMRHSLEQVEGAFSEAIKLLIIAGGAAPRRSWVYEYVEDPGWPAETPSGTASTGPFVHNVKIDLAVADDCAVLRTATNWSGANHIRLAIERLAIARSRFSSAEKVIELGTCLEILLMHEVAADQKAEISFKMRLRAAWLLGESAERRREVYKLVQRLYDLRSKAVHNGTITGSKKRGELSSHDISSVLAQTDSLCVDLIRHILFKGTPDWNSVVLGGSEGRADQMASG